MILYFSGTGNSRAVATLLGQLLKEPVSFILDQNPRERRFTGKYLIIVFPIYSWGIAPVLLDYIRGFSPEFIREVWEVPVYAVCTCGDDTGMAMEMMVKALDYSGLRLRGSWSVQMPNNYVLLPGFDVDAVNVEEDKLERFPARVRHIAEVIARGEGETDVTLGSFPRLKTRIVYPLFKKWGIAPSRWQATDACVGCGKCERSCTTGNIRIDKASGHPVWGSNCVSCLACYHICPVNAVQYGRATKGKGQYWCKVKL